MDFLAKLDLLMDKYNLTKSSFSQQSGIPYTTIDAWYKKGYEGLKLTTLRKIAAYFNTTLDFWILDEITDPNYGKTSGFHINYMEMEHIKKYRTLDAHGKDMVDTVLDKEHDRCVKISTPQLHLLPNAAHERTDIEVTEEMKQNDNDIMNDPDF